ncbi:tyrosine-type recombinase/integrase [Nocardia sp. NBC_00508]|uniref:tyrosine-type recombinase/integrase n=1 Tax=Nocardia sp. NBC_00508 TaxID=2975992 RepID=UPI002E7FC47A|nr:tyrosine-type recombinase/integrase [Nocardia sp. NBC_00508]
MNTTQPPFLRPVDDVDPIWRLWRELPGAWQGSVIGPEVENWEAFTELKDHNIILTGLPELMAAELAWMAHWQAQDGTRSSVLAINHLAGIVRHAIKKDHPFPLSIREMDWETASTLQGWYYASRLGRMTNKGVRARLRILFRFARLALLARCHDGHWWELDYWHPRCDPRIPLSQREPQANYGAIPGQITQPWLRPAVKWYLGTALEAGTLRWSTVSQERLKCWRRFDTWLTECVDDPTSMLGDPAVAAGQATQFQRWAADPRNRLRYPGDQRDLSKKVHPRLVNDDLRAVAELMDFIAANPSETRAMLGPSPWDQITPAHAASWFAQVTRIPHTREFNDAHYVDDHALAQITAALPVIGLPRDEQMAITRGDRTQITADGLNNPQAMRMILLQILTGRRSSEIRTCAFDCLSAPPASTVTGTDGDQIARFHYAQSKIDVAPDTILVDQEVVEVIEEQRRWIRERFPDQQPRFLFMQRSGNRNGDKPYPYGSYAWILRRFGDLLQITDGQGRPVRLSHTHRFRHTRLTRLAELGLPIHVLQRYAGHATPTMTMHYIAAREQHAEQAFLATVKLKADGTRVQFSRDDHDSMHLFDRADRFLPNGWCLLPPLQSCDKGNACLTCSVFATDSTHRSVLQRQLDDTAALINRTQQNSRSDMGG